MNRHEIIGISLALILVCVAVYGLVTCFNQNYASGEVTAMCIIDNNEMQNIDIRNYTRIDDSLIKIVGQDGTKYDVKPMNCQIIYNEKEGD